MNTISNYQSLISWYTQSSSQNTATSCNVKNDGANQADNKVKDVLENLVTSGTISEEQEISIQTAIESAISLN